MNYWIIVDDHHDGPYTGRQLVDNGLQPETLVWTEGLSDWTPAGDIAELAALLEHFEPKESADAEPAQCEATHVEPIIQNIVVEEFTPAQEPAPQYNPQPEPQPLPCAEPAATAAIEPCPPSYIAWSIIVTLLCCTIVGIPAIVFASMTKSAYYRGNIEKAKRYSELAQWFIIAAIVLGVVCWPFQIIFMSL